LLSIAVAPRLAGHDLPPSCRESLADPTGAGLECPRGFRTSSILDEMGSPKVFQAPHSTSWLAIAGILLAQAVCAQAVGQSCCAVVPAAAGCCFPGPCRCQWEPRQHEPFNATPPGRTPTLVPIASFSIDAFSPPAGSNEWVRLAGHAASDRSERPVRVLYGVWRN
jgi:hypothetical protein